MGPVSTHSPVTTRVVCSSEEEESGLTGDLLWGGWGGGAEVRRDFLRKGLELSRMRQVKGEEVEQGTVFPIGEQHVRGPSEE